MVDSPHSLSKSTRRFLNKDEKEERLTRRYAPRPCLTSKDLIVLRNGVEQVVGEARTGDLCGETGVLCYRPQLFTVRTKRLRQLLRLNHTSFLNTVQVNVSDGTIIMNNLLQHMKELNDLTMDVVLLETEDMLVHGRMDLPFSLSFAAIRGDDLLLHQLLRRGLDPNEADNNKRTYLVGKVDDFNCFGQMWATGFRIVSTKDMGKDGVRSSLSTRLFGNYN